MDAEQYTPGDHLTRPTLSNRVKGNLNPNKLGEVRAYCYYKQYDSKSNPDGIVALAIAENKLMRHEITRHINDNFAITPWHLTYGEGPVGSTSLRTELAAYMNSVFKPYVPIKDSHICMCSGAGNAVHNLSGTGSKEYARHASMDFVTTPIHEIGFMESPVGAMSPIEYCTIKPAAPYQGAKNKGPGRVETITSILPSSRSLSVKYQSDKVAPFSMTDNFRFTTSIAFNGPFANVISRTKGV